MVFLDITSEKAKERGGYGDERYEKEEMQRRVREIFHRIGEEMILGDSDFSSTRWAIIDAGRDQDEVAKDVWMLVKNLVTKGVEGSVKKLWITEN